jgi:hypothetical protein
MKQPSSIRCEQQEVRPLILGRGKQQSRASIQATLDFSNGAELLLRY